MNKIFKVIWSKSRNCYVVASELAKGTSKSTSTGRMAKRAALAAVAALVISPLGAGYVSAADYVTVKDTSGTEQTVYTKDGVDTQLTDLAKQTQVSTNTTDIATNKSNIETLQKNTQKISYATDYAKGITTIDSNLQVTDHLAVGSSIVAGTNVNARGFVTTAVATPTSVNQLTISGSTIQGGTATKTVEVNSKNNVSLTAGTRQTNSATVSGGNVINQASYTILNNAGTGIQNNVSGDNGYISNSAAQIKSVASKTITEQITGTDSEGNQAVVNEVKSDANGTTFTNSGSSTTIKGNAISTGSIDATGNISAASVDVSDKLTAGSASVTNSISVGHNANVGGAVNAGSLNSRGNLSVDGNALVKGTLTSQSTINGNEIVSQTNITAKNKVVGMQGVVDNTLTSGNYVTAGNTVGENIVALDTQVKSNTDAITAEAAAREAKDNELNERITNEANAIHETTNQLQSDLNTETAARQAADNELNERITNEANAIHETTNQLQNDLTAETSAREAGDTALNERITNVKEYLEKQTSDNYVSKTDAAVQNGAVVKAANTIGENVTNLDAALAKETAARIGADAAQDKVIQQVNDNLVASVNTINKNMADGFNTLSQVDAKEAQERAAADAALDDKITAETSARVAADTKLVEAVNSGLSLNDDNVLQKNTTTIDAQGNVTTSKTDANEMILNKGKDNQITLNENGIKVGTNSTVVDKDGVYTGGDTYAAAKAALKSDGSIKGADGKFTVNSSNGTVNVNDQIELNGATGVVKSNGLNVGDGNMTVSNNGNIQTAGTLSVADGNFKVNGNGGVSAAGGKTTLASDGSIKAADGKFTVNSNGGVKAADGKITLSSDGSVKAADGKFTVDSNGAVKAANGNTTIDSNGNLKTAGTLSAADGAFKVDSNGKITSTGLDAGNGTIQTTGTVQAGDVKTGTLETTGDATIGGNLTVDKNLTVNGEFNAKTLSSKLDENNYTTITGGKTQSMNLKMNTATGETQASASTFDETGSNMWAKDDDSIGRSTVTADSISQKLSNTGDNPTAYAESTMSQGTDNKYSMTDTVKDGDKTNMASQSATESSDVVTDADGNTSTFRQKVDAILQKINNADNTKSSSVEQKLDSINSKVTDGTNTTLVEQGTTDITNTASNGTISNIADKVMNQGTTSITSQIGDGTAVKSEMTADGITNTAVGGTITNSAKDLVNTATGDMTNTVGKDLTTTVGGEMKTTVTGKVTEDYKSDLDTKVGGNETHYVAGNQTNTVSGDRTVNVKGTETENFNAQVTNVKTDQKTSVGGNQTNIVAGDQQNTVSGSKLETVKGSVTEKYGSQATTVDGDQSTNVGGNQSNVVAGDQTNTISGSKTESVKGAVTETYGSQSTTVNGNQSNTVKGTLTETVTGDVTEDYKANLSTTVGGNQTTTVTGDSSLTAENINNTAKNKITNKALDVETDASSSIVSKVSNDAGSNTSTQLSYQTKEEMSQADGKTASYLRGAAEEKSQLTDGDKKTTIDTVAGQTNTNITEGKNISNSLQKADQVASSVTDGTNTTVVNQDAKSLASSITDGTKANNISNTVDKSEQLIKASDTQYSATTKTATKTEDALVSGSSVIDVIKNLDDAGNPTISSAVMDGTNSTGVTQTAKDITNTAKNGTIANDAKDIVNNAAENMTNTIGKDLTTTVGGEMKTTVTGKATENYNGGLETTITGEEKHTVNGDQTNNITGSQTNTIGGSQTTTVTGDSSLSAKNITNSATEKLSNSAAEIENTASKSITDKVGDNVSTTMSTDSIVNKVGKTTITTTDGKTKLTNEDGTHETEMDYATVLKDLGVRGSATVDQNLTVKGDSDLQGNATVGKNLTVKGDSDLQGNATVGKNLTVNGTSDLKGDVTMESNATVKKDLTVEGTTTTDQLIVNNGATVTGGTTTDTLHVTSTSTFDGAATFKDVVTMEKDLSVGGNATVAGSMTASSYKVGNNTYIDSNGINANNQKIVNVAAGDLSASSTDAVNGAQLYQTNERVTGVENKVNNLDSRVDKVGANAAALANLHPLEFDADSKWNIAAAVGGYKGETATAIGAFYRPNENVMVNVSSSFGTGENMYGGGISLRIGQGGNKARRNATNGLTDREKAMQKQIDSLTNRLDALLSVINPNMSKEFPDVPENHWAYEAVSKLAGNGIVQGYEDGKYHGERTMTRYEMAEIIYNALSKGAKAEKKLVEEFKPELQAMAAQKKA